MTPTCDSALPSIEAVMLAESTEPVVVSWPESEAVGLPAAEQAIRAGATVPSVVPLFAAATASTTSASAMGPPREARALTPLSQPHGTPLPVAVVKRSGYDRRDGG